MKKIDLLICSHGRQGTLSINLSLALAKGIHCPFFYHTDKHVFSGEGERISSPDLGKWSYQACYPEELNLKFVLIYHAFSRGAQLPGRAKLALSSCFDSNSPAVIFARHPLENFKSSFKQYLRLLSMRRFFSVDSNLPLSAMGQVLNTSEFYEKFRYIFRYDKQYNTLSRITRNVIIKNFSELDEKNFDNTMIWLQKIAGVDSPESPGRPYVNNSELFDLCVMFSNHNVFYYDQKFKIHVGVFHKELHPLLRGSFETGIADVKGVLPAGFGFFVSSIEYFSLPWKYRELIASMSDAQDVLKVTAGRFIELKNSLRDVVVPDFDFELPAEDLIKWNDFSNKYLTA